MKYAPSSDSGVSGPSNPGCAVEIGPSIESLWYSSPVGTSVMSHDSAFRVSADEDAAFAGEDTAFAGEDTVFAGEDAVFAGEDAVFVGEDAAFAVNRSCAWNALCVGQQVYCVLLTCWE